MLFSCFCAHECEARKERGSTKIKECKKAKAQSAKKQKRQVQKSANSRFFLPPTLEAQFQGPKLIGKGKSKGFMLDVQFSVLNIIITFHYRRLRGRGREERQRGRDRGVSQREKDRGEETEGKRQRGRDRGRDI